MNKQILQGLRFSAIFIGIYLIYKGMALHETTITVIGIMTLIIDGLLFMNNGLL